MQEIWKDIIGPNKKYQISNFGNIKNHKNQIKKHYSSQDGYCFTTFRDKNKKTFSKFIHQLVWQYFGNGEISDHNKVIDHIDNDKTNNRIDNLQLISQRDNIIKSRKKMNSSSKFTGVHWRSDNNKWASYIYVKPKTICLGHFNSEAQAGLAYLKAKLKYTGSLGEI